MDRTGVLAAVLLAAAVLLSASLALVASPAQSGVSSPGGSGVSSASPAGLAPTAAPESSGVVTVNGLVGTQTSGFWSMSMDGTTDPANHTLASLLNATPVRTLRYGANWVDQTNWSLGCMYTTSACGSVQNNVSDFATLCKWLPKDTCILGTPGEINSVSTLVYELKWLHSTQSWWPNCFEIGNEPTGWKHFGIPWTSWSSSDAKTPSVAQYDTLARNYTDAIRSLDPGACIIGLEAENTVSGVSWVSSVASNQTNVTYDAYHTAADQACGGGQSTPEILARSNMTLIARYYAQAKSGSGGIPVAVDEMHLARSPCQPWLGSYTDAAWISAQIAQGLADGMLHMTFFRFAADACNDCMIDQSTSPSNISWDYYLYSGLFSRMFVSYVYNVTFTGGNPETFMVMGTNGASNETLLISNANATVSDTFDLSGIIPLNWSDQITTQNSTSVHPVTGPIVDPVTIVTLPPQSTMLVDFFPAPVVSTSGGGLLASSASPPTATEGVGILVVSAAGLVAVALAVSHLPTGRHKRSHKRHGKRGGARRGHRRGRGHRAAGRR